MAQQSGMPTRARFQCRDLYDLAQRGHDTNFSLALFYHQSTSFNRDQKYSKNHTRTIELPYSLQIIKILELNDILAVNDIVYLLFPFC